MIRKGIFWLHLICGIAAGAVILIMSVTGVILTYERQILAWEDRAYFAEPAPGQAKLPVETLVASANSEDFTPESVVVSSDPRAPVVLRQGRSQSVYLNPYTGQEYAPHSPALDNFFLRSYWLASLVQYQWRGASECTCHHRCSELDVFISYY